MRVKRRITHLLLLLGLGAQTCQASNAEQSDKTEPLKSVAAVRRLSSSEAAKKLPLKLKALVTFFDPDWRLLCVQEQGTGIYVESADGAIQRAGDKLKTGSVVEIEGYSGAGMFAPIVFCRDLRVLGQEPLPDPRPLAFDQFQGGREDSQWVTVAGVVRRAKILHSHLELDLAAGERSMLVYIPNVTDPALAASYVDSAVTVSGVCATVFKDRKWIGSRILAPSLQELKVRRPGSADPFSLPVQPLSALGRFAPDVDPGHRVKIAGVVSWNDGAGSLYVQDDSAGIRVQGDSARLQAKVGDGVEAVGFPVLAHSPHLAEGEVRVVGPGPALEPLSLNSNEALDADNINGRLVAIEGRILDCKHRPDRTTLELSVSNEQAEGPSILQASLAGTLDCPQPASLVRITGVADVSPSSDRPKSVAIRLRSADDLVVLSRAPWWTAGKVLGLVAILACAALIGMVWIFALRRQVRRQTRLLREHSERLQALSGQLITAQEAERSHLARELHDEFAQVLATVNFHLLSLKGRLDPKAQPCLDECTAILNQAIDKVRSLALDLRPTMLDLMGLEAALHWLVRRHEQSGICAAQLIGHVSEASLPADLSITCFRVVQEALINVMKHAQARQVVVTLHHDEAELRLEIKDDGVGFDVGNTLARVVEHKSFGLLGIRERVQLFGGHLDIESAPGQGARIAVRFPLARASNGASRLGGFKGAAPVEGTSSGSPEVRP